MRFHGFGAAALVAATLAAATARADVLLNEILVNPPGADDSREYVELRAAPGESLADTWLLEVEGDGTGAGVVENAVNLSSVTAGASGIVLLGHGYATTIPWPGVSGDTVRANLGRSPSAIENGGVTFFLVRGFTAAVGADLDANNDGILDSMPWSQILDGVGWVDPATSGRVYASAVVSLAGGIVDAVTRLPDDSTPGGSGAWYGGDVASSGASPDLSTAYDLAHVTANFPAPPVFVSAGALTPGAPNVPAALPPAVCGNGVLEAGEGCDDANLEAGDCCGSDCTIEPSGTRCRPAIGACDAGEVCDGATALCPGDEVVPAGEVCRAAAGVCDAVEFCDGISTACPPDGVRGSGDSCRPAAGACDVAEVCDGVSATCGPDLLVSAGETCRSSIGPCDRTEVCDGSSVECEGDALEPAGTPCRAGVGACDVAEVCDGSDAACPADERVDDGTACDDGDSCTEGDACWAGECGGAPGAGCRLAPFVCHKTSPAKAPRGTPPFAAFTPRVGDVVEDGFTTAQPLDRLDLLRSVGVCGSFGPLTPGRADLALYAAKLTRTEPKQSKPVKSVHTIETSIGRVRVRIDGIARLVAPATIARGSDGAEPLVSNGADHFQCYRVSVAKEPGNGHVPATLALEDPIAGPRTLLLASPSHLCTPASLNGADPSAPGRAGHLLCFKSTLAKLDPPQPKDAKVRLSVATGFGPEVVDAGKTSEVCLPAARLD